MKKLVCLLCVLVGCSDQMKVEEEWKNSLETCLEQHKVIKQDLAALATKVATLEQEKKQMVRVMDELTDRVVKQQDQLVGHRKLLDLLLEGMKVTDQNVTKLIDKVYDRRRN